MSPFEGNHSSFLYVTEDKKEAVLFLYRVMNVPNAPLYRIPLDGLEPSYQYQIDDGDLVVRGDQLMNYGLNEPDELKWGDFKGKVIRLKALV